MRHEIKSLTALRAVAAALVFFYHFVYLRNPVPASSFVDVLLKTGFIGVDLMFVLSGFVLTLRYHEDVAQNRLRLGSYLWRRIARLYPSYFVLLLGIALLGVPVNITNVTITQGFFTQYFQTGIINSWSLTAEECFYLLLPILLWLLIRQKSLSLNGLTLAAFAVVMPVLGLLLVQWSWRSGLAEPGGFLADSMFVLNRTIFGYGLDFAVGIAGALLYQHRGALRAGASTILALIAFAGIAVCLYQMAYVPDELSVRLWRWAVTVFCVMLVFALTCEQMAISKVMSWRPIVYLGRISYGLYLVQLTQLVWFMAEWRVLAFYVGCNVASAVLYHVVENPARVLLIKGPTAWRTAFAEFESLVRGAMAGWNVINARLKPPQLHLEESAVTLRREQASHSSAMD